MKSPSQSGKRPALCAEEPDTFQGKWFVPEQARGGSPSWHAWRGSLRWKGGSPAVVRLGADSKYWLFINGILVVREGGLKRGPTPGGTYVDRLDLTTHLQPGENAVAVRVWYFGRDGFSHKDSGCPGLRPQPADLSAFDIVTPTPLGPLKTTFRKTANGAGSYVIESPDGCPIEWDLTALLLPKNARLCANGERFGAARTGQAPGGHLRLEWKP